MEAITLRDPALIRRLMARTQITSGGCWRWTGARLPKTGYGKIKVNRRHTYVHRLSHELFVGPIPADRPQIDHVKANGCEHTDCWNPGHLEAVTPRTNLLRGNTVTARKAAQTHCIHGHEFTEANTYITALNQRRCRCCDKLNTRARRARRKAELHRLAA